MAYIPANVSEWSVDTNELAYYVGPSRSSANMSSYPVYIPKLMPLVSMGNKSTKSEAISPACFINASDCKPSIASKVTTSNFIQINRNQNQEFRNSLIDYGSKFQVDIRNKDVDEIFLSNRIDPSYNLY